MRLAFQAFQAVTARRMRHGEPRTFLDRMESFLRAASARARETSAGGAEVLDINSVFTKKAWRREGSRGDEEWWTLNRDGSCAYHYNRDHDVFGNKDEDLTGTFSLRMVAHGTVEAVLHYTHRTLVGQGHDESGAVDRTERLTLQLEELK